ncbi:Coenzyme Q-binding protein coq10a, mitochondrial [Coemansia sp. BCRC 34301]|nr:Coenzyme Q-binding protein coq10a, mitochondrial [Coemansia sp. BCRC 34301]
MTFAVLTLLRAARVGARPGCGARSFLTLVGSSSQKQYRDSMVFPFSREQVFQVVADIDKYCEFVPLCVGSKVLHDTLRHADSISGQCVQAELLVGYPPFNERYISTVELDHPRRIVAMAAPGSSMFKHMRTVWGFSEHDPRPYGTPVSPFIQARGSSGVAAPGTLVSFSIEFEFASLLHAHTASLVFDRMAKRNLEAYLGRCQQLYGK